MRRFKFDATLNFAAVLTISSVIVSAVVIWVHTDDKISSIIEAQQRIELDHQKLSGTLEKLRTAIAELAVQNVRIVSAEKRLDRLEAFHSKQ